MALRFASTTWVSMMCTRCVRPGHRSDESPAHKKHASAFRSPLFGCFEVLCRRRSSGCHAGGYAWWWIRIVGPARLLTHAPNEIFSQSVTAAPCLPIAVLTVASGGACCGRSHSCEPSAGRVGVAAVGELCAHQFIPRPALFARGAERAFKTSPTTTLTVLRCVGCSRVDHCA